MLNHVVCRGVALESLGRYNDAAEQYLAVLAVDSADPAALNNLGADFDWK